MRLTRICGNCVILGLLPAALLSCQSGHSDTEEAVTSSEEALTSAEEDNLITAAWTALGGAAVVGNSTAAPADLPGGVGRYQTFVNGVIVWSNDNGAVLVPTAILNFWIGLTSQQAAEDPTRTRFDYIGLPKNTSDSPPANDTVAWDAKVNFDRGIIGVKSGQVLSVEGNIFARYAVNPAQWGFPTGTPAHTNISNLQFTWIGEAFTGGEIWTRGNPSAGFVTVDLKSGPVFNTWVAAPQFGDPVSSIVNDGIGGQMGVFNGGNIFSAGVTAFGVPNTPTDGSNNSLLTTYIALGGPKSWLGYPTSNSGTSAGGSVFSQFQNGLLTMAPNGSGGFFAPQQFGQLTFVYDSAQDTDSPGCFGVTIPFTSICVGSPEGPFMQTQVTVFQDGNPTPIAGPATFPPQGSGCTESFVGFTLSSQSNVFCDNGQQAINFTVPLGVAQGSTGITVQLVSQGFSDSLFSGSSPPTLGHLTRHFNIDNQWGLNDPHQITAPDNGSYNFTSHVQDTVPFDNTDWRGALWWSFHNFNTAEMSRATYVDTFVGVPINFNAATAWGDGLYYDLVYKNSANNGNCFGMGLDSIDVQFNRRTSYFEPLHQFFSGAISTQDGRSLDASANASYADLAHEINVKFGYQLGVDMINYALVNFIGSAVSPSSTLGSVIAGLANNDHPLFSITSDLFFKHGHVIRPYRVGPSGVPCQNIGTSGTCTQVFVLDPNIPSALESQEQFVEFSTDNQWAYNPVGNSGAVYPAGQYSGGLLSGGRIMYVPYSVLDHQPSTPIAELGELLAAAAIIIFSDSGTVNQVTDDSGRTLFNAPVTSTTPRWEDLKTGSGAIPNMTPIPLGDPSNSAATVIATKGLTTVQHYDVGLAPGQANGTSYEAMFASGLMTTDVVAPGTTGVSDQVTLTKLGTADKSVAFKIPTAGASKAINWSFSGPDKLRPIVLSNLTVQPAQELTGFLENGANRIKIKNNGPGTSATIMVGSATQAPTSAGTIQIPPGESGEDCSWNGNTPVCKPMTPELDSIFGFESGADWSGQGFPLTIVSSPKTEGFFALAVGSSGFRELFSIPFSTSILQGITSKLALDVYIPTGPSNPYWLGAVQLYANCPSANVYHSYQGQVELTGKPLGAFTTATFNLTSQVVAAMKGKHSDFSVSIAVNASPAAQSYVLDNLRFTQ